VDEKSLLGEQKFVAPTRANGHDRGSTWLFRQVVELSKQKDVNQILALTSEIVHALIPSSQCVVLYLQGSCSGKLTVQTFLPQECTFEPGRDEDVLSPAARMVLQDHRSCVLYLGVSDLEPLAADWLCEHKVAALMAVPLLVEKTLWGLVEVRRGLGEKEFTPEELELCELVASQATVALENAYLHERARDRLVELTFLNQVGQTITSTLELEDILTLIINEARSVLHVEAGSVLLRDEETDELLFTAVTGVPPDLIQSMRLKMGQGIAGWVARHGEPVLVPDVCQDERFFAGVDKAIGFQTGSILCVPLKMGERVLGVVEVINKVAGSFTQNDLALLEAIAGPAAIAIENARLFNGLRELSWETIRALAQAIEAKDPYTRGHSEQVSHYAAQIALRMGLPSHEVQDIRYSGLLHDIGKIGLSDGILLKPGRLSSEEFEAVKLHPVRGYEIVQGIRPLRKIAIPILLHHERMDGQGYPEGRRGDQIPLSARIMAVADAFDAMTSDRVYRSRLPLSQVADILNEGVNVQWDSEVVHALLGLIHEQGEAVIQQRR